MVVHKPLTEVLGDDEPKQAEAAAAPEPAKSTRKPRRPRGAAPATPKDTAPPAGETKPAEKKGRGAARSRNASEPKAEPAPKPEPPTEARVLVPLDGESSRVGLYLHHDDYKALGLAKLEDRADLNSRMRAMIALWRSNARFRAQVDKLARTAPRGPYSGTK
jgi:hypothetical protein